MTAVRLSPKVGAAVDNWANKQDDKPSRSEAIRRLVDIGLRDEVREEHFQATASASAASLLYLNARLKAKK